MTETRVAAFFDVDGTLLRGASTWYLAQDLYQRGYFGAKYIAYAAWYSCHYLLFGEKRKNVQKIKEHSLAIIKGKLQSDLVLIGEELYDRFIEERLFPGALDIIAEHLQAGHEVWLVSATPQEISGQIAHRLGLTGGLGTVVEVGPDGRYTGRMPKSLLHGKAKAEAVGQLALRRNLDLSRCYAYSDSMSDLPLFREVGYPRVVNPEPKLRRLAARRHWPIYNFAYRSPNQSLAARLPFALSVVIGLGWTAQILWRYVLRRLARLPLRAWRRLRRS